MVEQLSYTQKVVGSSPTQSMRSVEHGAPRAHNPYRFGGSTPPTAQKSVIINFSFKITKNC